MDCAPLYSLEAEQAFVGSMFLDESLIKDCTISCEQLYSSVLRKIFSTMKRLDEKGKPIDIISFIEEHGVNNLKDIGGSSYLTRLAGSVPSTANFHFYEDTVRQYAQKRKTIAVASKIMEEVYNGDFSKTVRDGIQELMAIEDCSGEDELGQIKDSLVEIYDDCEKNFDEITGIASGFQELDKLTAGFQESDLIIVGARPSVGKTAFAHSAGSKSCGKGCQHYFFNGNAKEAAAKKSGQFHWRDRFNENAKSDEIVR